MTKIILPNKTVEAYWAGLSVVTNNFNALLPLGGDVAEIVNDFSGVESFTVEAPNEPTVTYEGFTVFDSLNEREDGIRIRLRKE